ncbi:MAG TPA: sigma-70 family RNA polymerase sigma factor [Candidatus Limnocylindrales bacterium]|nr:sigma-70 family RNA polymerase sigma factor [Candidatus Limnocylindrales bacterium]
MSALQEARMTAAKMTWDFDSLVREHQAMVFSVALHFLRDRAVAEEVAQEVFLSLHRNLGSIESDSHARYWLRKVTVQRSIDEGRRRKRQSNVSLEDVAEPISGARPGDPMLQEMLRRLVATLPEAPRMVMILRYQEDLDPGDIAELMNMPVATVKSHLQRSLALLREKLARRGLGEI